MNRLVCYSESSDDEESRLSYQEKDNYTVSTGDSFYSWNVKDKAACHQDHSELSSDFPKNIPKKDNNLTMYHRGKNDRSNIIISSQTAIETVSPDDCDSFSNDTARADEQESHQYNDTENVMDKSRHSVTHDNFLCTVSISHKVNTSSSSECLLSKHKFHDTCEQCNYCCTVANIKNDVNHCESKIETMADTKLSEQLKNSDVVPRSVPTNLSESANIAQTARKRKHSNQIDSFDKSDLFLPDTLKTMFYDHRHKWVDNPAEHDNRIRSFPHLEGNWAAHIFFPVQQDERFQDLVHSVIHIFEPLEFKAFSEFHISLSRTVAIRHHWIEPLVASLREQLKPLKSGLSDMTAIKLFTNDEKTRTFICIELSQEDTEFMQYVTAVDKCLLEFKLPVYYENPSFHISIGWCLGNVVDEVSEDKLVSSKEMLSNFIADNPDLSTLLLQQVYCRTGNKMFAITLED